MQTKVKIPKTEKRSNILALKVSDNEQEKIKRFCKQKQITQSALIRFALKKVVAIF